MFLLTPLFSEQKLLRSARRILEHVAGQVRAPVRVRLWDGATVELGKGGECPYEIAINGPGVIGSLLRRPTLDNLVRHYAQGRIELGGGDLVSFGEKVRVPGLKGRLRKLDKWFLLWRALPFLLCPASRQTQAHRHADMDRGAMTQREDRECVQFHYDLSNDFYALLLDSQMQYSCGYFTDWSNDLEQAQQDKLEMICRKLRLQPGENLLDIGCGWGGLICHAAARYGVRAHGVTLSERQFAFAQEKIRRAGLQDRVSVALCDYREVTGTYDKIASIGMFEHVGIANYAAYFGKMYSLLRDRGILLNHSIARGAKASRKRFRRLRPEHRFIQRFIFPGSELDHIGHTLEAMEASRFEIHDVEGWRDHYARTTKLWCQRLWMRREEAEVIVGPERLRLWLAYLAGVSFAFADGSLRIFQVVATKHSAKGASGMPPTREELYR